MNINLVTKTTVVLEVQNIENILVCTGMENDTVDSSDENI